ncbi:DCP2, partial [Symbiodinium microadriaticum]
VDLLLEVSQALASHGSEISRCFRFAWNQLLWWLAPQSCCLQCHQRLEQPRCGAVILDEALQSCLMVQSHKSGLWFFPSGKLEDGETEVNGAIREVWEETGLDLQGRVDERLYLKAFVTDNGRVVPVKLFVILRLPPQRGLKPQAKKEIAGISWIRNEKLPGWPGGAQSATRRFLHIEHFVPQLQKLLKDPDACLSSDNKALAGGWLDIRRMMEAFEEGWAR